MFKVREAVYAPGSKEPVIRTVVRVPKESTAKSKASQLNEKQAMADLSEGIKSYYVEADPGRMEVE